MRELVFLINMCYLCSMAYLYTHTRLDNNEIFYVGIGKQKNYKRASFIHNRNIHWKNVTKKTGWTVDIVFDNLTWEEACEKEKELIKKLGRIDLGTGKLTNMTNGGNGNDGIKMSPESIKKRNESRRKNGWIVSEERKKKQSISMLGKNNKKIIDNATGIIYDSITDASEKLNINRSTLSSYLIGRLKNKTELTYLL
jgi:hypothetical protein